MIRPVDPALIEQLDAAEKEGGSAEVAAICLLQGAFDKSGAVSQKNITRVVNRLLKSVAETTGTVHGDHNVFKSMGSFVVAAPAAFIRELISREEIRSAMANVTT